ncbi:glycine/betaine ABC transporter substrate-binding protein [Alkalibaculum sp. M08DMB]|uniref:Glycine/betaine ABC transporter substrate-binding protein n=1 Tax=Alkalibaculum sporogenes TaxID=2655001 RepID=A0A6A7K549_9FIRM|nr:glycine betaine ABC transporter substrate-binding protein [Alkalibaculum sporogenes]MPW24586.1 glycine/betaine ABC transporter substrate-binding protein [Alkalibaculum sporogenes]
MSLKKLVLLIICLFLTTTIIGCQSSDDEIIIIDGQYSESRIIHQMVKLLVEEHTDAKITIKDEMTPVNSYNETVKGNADIMNSYDGTLLTTFLKLDPSDVPEDENIYDFSNRIAVEQDSVYLLDKLGINNTYAIAVPQNLSEQYNLLTITDLKEVDDQLIFGAEHEFFDEEGTMKFNPFTSFYGLEFKESRSVDLGLKYSAIESNNIDITVVYSTDGLNKKAQLTILEDDQDFFPEYNGALLVREDLFDRYSQTAPNLKETLNLMGNIFDNDTMVELTYAVDVDGESPISVAKEFLQSKGLIE